jgi:hypothetical protein
VVWRARGLLLDDLRECGVGRMPAAESETSVHRYFGYVITRSIGRWEEGSAIGVLYSGDDVN